MRLVAYLIVGLLLGAVSSLTFAAGAIWAGKDGFIIRGSDGRIQTIRMADESELGPSLSRTVDRNAITYEAKGEWVLEDKNGNPIRTPGKQSVKIPGGPLSKAAGAAAFAAKGTIGGIIVGALAGEAVTLIENEWSKKQRITNEYTYDCMNAQCRGIDSPEAACAFETDRVRKRDALVGYNYTYTDVAPIPASNGIDYNCRAWVVKPQISSGEETTGGVVGMKKPPYDKQVPATQADLENALDARRQKIDDALKDYYNALPQSSRDQLAKDHGEISAQGDPVTTPPKTSTTTAPDGTTTTTSTSTTYNIVNNGNTFNTSVVTVTNTTSTSNTTNGQTTTTTTTETGAPLKQEAQDVKTDCEKFPNSIGCSEYGDVSDIDLERKELTGTVVPEQVGGVGQCPAPLAANVAGVHAEFSFDPLCQYANVIRPIALAFAWLAAGYLLMGVVRGEG